MLSTLPPQSHLKGEILISQRIFPAGCDFFSDIMSPSKISWLTKGNMKHVDVRLKINWALIFNFGNLLGPFD